jgi:hypothetical protein
LFLKKNKKRLSNDIKGVLFTSDIFIILIVSILIIATITSVIDLSNEKIFEAEERSSLERISVEVLDNLIKTLKSPSGSDYDIKSNPNFNLVGGDNSILFNKLLDLKKSYNKLVDENIFQNEIKSLITIYPLNCEISPIEFGNKINSISNVVTVKRLIKCDFLTKFLILNFKEKTNNNCINQNHKNDNSYTWICKPFKIEKKDLKINDYYLIFNDESIGNKWIINNPKNLAEEEHSINTNSYKINQILENQIGNSPQMNFWIHLKIRTNNIDNFDGSLVAIPKDFNINEISKNGLKLDYFQYNDCYLILKTWH